MDFEIAETKDELIKHGYEYIKTIGIGNYSQVFLCKSLKYNILFAVKRVRNEKVTDLECNALISLHHRYIVQLYEIIKEGENTYLVMDYCSNKTLMQKGRMNTNQFVQYARQVLEALSYCHSKCIAHRDIKPDNIFIDQYDRIKVADFGFAKQFECKRTNERCGSIMYCAPEIVKNNKACFDPFEADVYALGVTFFYMATGRLPFDDCVNSEELKRSIIFGQIDLSDVDIDVKNVITKMTSRNPKLRPSIDEILKMPLFSTTMKMASKSQSRILNVAHCINKSKSFSCGYQWPNEQIVLKQPTQSVCKCKNVIKKPIVPVNSLLHTFNH